MLRNISAYQAFVRYLSKIIGAYLPIGNRRFPIPLVGNPLPHQAALSQAGRFSRQGKRVR